MGDCPKEFLQFHETETEMRNDYETDSTEYVVMPDGTLKLPWDDCFKDPKFFGSFGTGSHNVPEGLERRNVPFKETYATFEEYAADWCGDEERDPEKGVFGYWENPNRKWDWYEVGGRWTGFFLAKKGVREGVAVGRPGLMTPQAEKGWYDQIRKGDVDFDGMRDDAEKDARWRYALVIGTTGPLTLNPWSFYRDDTSYGDNREGWDARRTAYHDQPAYVAAREKLREASNQVKDEKERDTLIWVELDDFLCTEDEYAQRHRDQAISTFAVLKGGIWYEKGKMGWWACVSDPKDEAEWLREFNLMLDTLDDDTLLTVVDCHI